MNTKLAFGLMAALLVAAAGCSDDDVTGNPGKLAPPNHDGTGGTGGSGGSDGGSGGGTGGNGVDPGRENPGVGNPGVPGDRPTVPPGTVTPPEGPWPVQDVVHYGSAEGIPGRVTGVGVDDAQNVYVIDSSAVYAAKAGNGRFVRTTTGGQLDTGHVPFCVCGGAEGRVYVGYLTYEKEPELLTEEEKLLGDMDRFALRDDGSLALEFHHKMENSNVRWMDHTRSILDCARVVGGPNHGDLYIGSNHGVTVIRGDDYADHRHAVWSDANGSLAIGYVWGVNTDPAGNLLFAGHWKLAAVPPAPAAPNGDLMKWLDYGTTPWIADTYPELWGSMEDPDEMHAIAGDAQAGRIYVGSWGKGLASMDFAPRKWTDLEAPDTHINSLELDPTDGKLWVGTRSAGLWRFDPATKSWEQIAGVPRGQVYDVYLDNTVTPRAVYAGTDSGLYVIRAQ